MESTLAYRMTLFRRINKSVRNAVSFVSCSALVRKNRNQGYLKDDQQQVSLKMC